MRRKQNNFLFLLFGIVIPLGAGALIYYFAVPDAWFVRQIDSLLGGGIHVEISMEEHPAFSILRCYLPDMLWGYALIFSLFFILDNNMASLRKIFPAVVCFTACMEFLQCTSAVPGTFDVRDIFAEIFAEVMAVIIIKIHFLRRKKKYEE